MRDVFSLFFALSLLQAFLVQCASDVLCAWYIAILLEESSSAVQTVQAASTEMLCGAR